MKNKLPPTTFEIAQTFAFQLFKNMSLHFLFKYHWLRSTTNKKRAAVKH